LLHRAGDERQKKHHKLSKLQIERLHEGWRERTTVDELADMLDVSKSAIARYIKEVSEGDREAKPPKLPKTYAEQERRLAAFENQTIREDDDATPPNLPGP
jgi:predicted transcriptional regulator